MECRDCKYINYTVLNVTLWKVLTFLRSNFLRTLLSLWSFTLVSSSRNMIQEEFFPNCDDKLRGKIFCISKSLKTSYYKQKTQTFIISLCISGGEFWIVSASNIVTTVGSDMCLINESLNRSTNSFKNPDSFTQTICSDSVRNKIRGCIWNHIHP